MKTSGFTILLLAALLSACHDSDNDSSSSNPPPTPIPNPVEPPPYDMEDMNNYIAATKYEQRYNNVVENCGSDSAPQYECSGLLFRGIRIAAQPKPWVHRQRDRDKGAVAFAYIRQDLNFKLPDDTYQAGIVIRPDYEDVAPTRCASPMDMNTDARTGSFNNCLKSDEVQYGSVDYTVKDCQDWGIDTPQKWLDIFIPVMRATKAQGTLDQFPGQTCSYTMSVSDQAKFATRANYFSMFAAIRKGVPTDLRPDWWNDEILVTAWNDEKATTAPIEAFYYNLGNEAGLEAAQSFQQAYYEDTQKYLPILAIDFKVDEPSRIYFSAHDQVVFENLPNLEKIKITANWLTPDPPAENSAAFELDKKTYQELLNPSASRWTLAQQDANITSQYLARRFLGFNYKYYTTEVTALINYMVDFEQPVANEIKAKYNRERPFVYYNSEICTPEDRDFLLTNTSYPSGHSLRGYLVGYSLSDVDNSRRSEFENTAVDYAKSRIVCRVHWLSDTEASKGIASMAMNILKYSPEYLGRVQAAKQSIQ